jgi:succinate-semialdehyde dehydrogenase/glutarate-semialdehyde dehydrogenase
MVTFTGSVPVGRVIGELAGRQLKPAVLELGGHAPVIVCEDADPVYAANMTARSKYRNAGQICIAPTRIYVHDAIYRRFEENFVAAASALKVGNGFEPGVEMGPLANARRRDAIEKAVATTSAEGARLAAGGHRVGNKGFFFAPTVLTDVPDSTDIMRSEPFGPVALLARFSDLDEACQRANDTPYGLAAYAFTESARLAAEISERVSCGVLSVNHFGGASPDIPFGGVRDSGFGREGGAECFDGYMVTKSVSHMLSASR